MARDKELSFAIAAATVAICWLLYGAIAAFLAALTIFVLSVKGFFPNF